MAKGNNRPSSQNELSFINELNLGLNLFSPMCENFDDFNISTETPNFESFMISFDLKGLIHLPTYYKPIHSTCIALILANKKKSFLMNSTRCSTGLSDHLKLTTTVLRKALSKGNFLKSFSAVITRNLTKRNLKLS